MKDNTAFILFIGILAAVLFSCVYMDNSREADKTIHRLRMDSVICARTHNVK